LSPHPLANWAGNGTILFTGQEADVATFDGGEAGVVTPISGPMWEIVAELAGRVPVGPGTLAVSETVVGRADIGGVDEHNVVLTIDQLPAHAHNIGISTAGLVGGNELGIHSLVSFNAVAATPYFGQTRRRGNSEPVELDNMPPYYGIFFLKKTARTHYRV